MNLRSCSTATVPVGFEGRSETVKGVGSVMAGVLENGFAFSTGAVSVIGVASSLVSVSVIGVASSLVSGIGAASSLGARSSLSEVSEEDILTG